MNHEIAFTDPGAANVIRDLQEILLLIQQIKAAGGGALFGGAGAPGGGSACLIWPDGTMSPKVSSKAALVRILSETIQKNI